MKHIEIDIINHYQSQHHLAGDMIAVIGLLRNREPLLPRNAKKLLDQFADVAGIALINESEEFLLTIQQIFKKIVLESIRERVLQQKESRQLEMSEV